MKIVFVQADGLTSAPLDEFGGRTPLQVASTPNLDRLAGEGEYGHLTLPPDNDPISSENIHLALLGYDPHKYYTGLGPFEAASLEVGLEKGDVAFLCHLVTLRSIEGKGELKKMGSNLLLLDDRAGDIESEEARELIEAVNEQLGSETIQFYSGKGHRHIMVWAGGMAARRGCDPPHTVLGRSIESSLPTGEGADILKELMEASWIVLRNHSVNIDREEAGLNPGNCLWLWGAGKAIELPMITDRWSLHGATISPVDLHLGMGICAGLEPVNLQNYEVSSSSDLSLYAKICEKVLKSKDLVYIHVPNLLRGEMKNGQERVKCLETFDEELVGSILKSLEGHPDYCLLVTCPPESQDGSLTDAVPTPYVLFRSSETKPGGAVGGFTEIEAGQKGHRDATRILERLLAES